MRITAIKQQVKRSDRYSIFVDEKYAFSLSESALLESKLASGDELSASKLKEFKQLSEDDKLYNQTLRYLALRPRSQWEVEFYLQRKKASPDVTGSILNKLSNIGLIDDEKFAKAYVNDRRLLKPTSRRKLVNELRKKRVANEIIEQAVGTEAEDENAALREVIARKRRQAKYQDDEKLMQYLARQGFSYGDIKEVLEQEKG
ncbi:MAG TPA: RecX family transcriptional regulator [Candidatus Saccharimonadales bacterium]|nr:RecX family transcriptional regulator [Candidatus Saccharimonadales bacterium]